MLRQSPGIGLSNCMGPAKAMGNNHCRHFLPGALGNVDLTVNIQAIPLGMKLLHLIRICCLCMGRLRFSGTATPGTAAPGSGAAGTGQAKKQHPCTKYSHDLCSSFHSFSLQCQAIIR